MAMNLHACKVLSKIHNLECGRSVQQDDERNVCNSNLNMTRRASRRLKARSLESVKSHIPSSARSVHSTIRSIVGEEGINVVICDAELVVDVDVQELGGCS